MVSYTDRTREKNAGSRANLLGFALSSMCQWRSWRTSPRLVAWPAIKKEFLFNGKGGRSIFLPQVLRYFLLWSSAFTCSWTLQLLTSISIILSYKPAKSTDSEYIFQNYSHTSKVIIIMIIMMIIAFFLIHLHLFCNMKKHKKISFLLWLWVFGECAGLPKELSEHAGTAWREVSWQSLH